MATEAIFNEPGTKNIRGGAAAAGIVLMFATYVLWPGKVLLFTQARSNGLQATVKMKLKDDKAYLNIGVEVFNSLPVKIKLDSATYYMTVGGVTLAQGERKPGKSLAGLESDTIHFPVTLNTKKAFAHIKSMNAHRQDSTSLDLHMNVYINAPWARNNMLPLSLDRKIEVPHPPEFVIRHVRLTNAGLKELRVIADLDIINPNPVAFRITDINVQLSFPGLFEGYIHLAEPLQIRYKDTTRVEVPMEVNDLNLLNGAGRLLFGNSQLSYRMSGSMNLHLKDVNPIPISVTKNDTLQLSL